MEEQNVIRELSIPIYQSKGWMKLLGVVLILQGVLMIFTLLGIVLCWLPIWLGVLLFKAASLAETAQLGGQKQALVESLSNIKMYFVINGILTLIFLIIAGLTLLIMGGSILALLSEM